MFNGPLSRTTRVGRYQKGKTNLDFTEARDSECQWHQLGHMQVCISLQTDNHANIPPLSFLQAGCPSCRPTNSVKALKAMCTLIINLKLQTLSCCPNKKRNQEYSLFRYLSDLEREGHSPTLDDISGGSVPTATDLTCSSSTLSSVKHSMVTASVCSVYANNYCS